MLLYFTRFNNNKKIFLYKRVNIRFSNKETIIDLRLNKPQKKIIPSI